MAAYLWIAIGSALGGVARYWTSGLVAHHFGETFPWGTLLVNVLGSFIIGLVATLTAPDGRMFVGTEVRQFLMLGICGGYTTFSSLSIETLELVRDGEMLRAGTYIALSVLLCLVAVWLGHIASVGLNQLKGS
jgi:CrcB protein